MASRAASIDASPPPSRSTSLRRRSRLLRVATGAGEERDRAEAVREPVDPHCDVPVERECGVVETPLEDQLVPGPNRLGVAAVRDEGEPVSAERKVALVGLHRRHDHPLGDTPEPLVELTGEDDRRLHEVDDLVQHGIRVAPGSQRVELRDDRRAPLAGVGDDARVAQRRLVVGRSGDLHVSRREAVAVRDRTGRDPVRAHVERLGIELRAEPPDRAREPDPVGQVPHHRLAGREPGGDPPETLRKRRRRLVAPHVAVADLELLDREAEPAGEPFRGARRAAVRERDAFGRAALLLPARLGVEAVHDDRDAPRPDERASLPPSSRSHRSRSSRSTNAQNPPGSSSQPISNSSVATTPPRPRVRRPRGRAAPLGEPASSHARCRRHAPSPTALPSRPAG